MALSPVANGDETPEPDAVRPATPDDLRDAGRAFFDLIADGYVLDPATPELLAQAARVLDTIAVLDADVVATGLYVPGSKGQQRLNPALTEARYQRGMFATLTARLNLPTEDADDDTTPMSARTRSQAGSALARRRWNR